MKKTIFGITYLTLILFASSAFGQTIRLEGQVVCCADCWAEADRTKVQFGTAEDLLKSQSCVANGDPTLIAVREGDKFTVSARAEEVPVAGKELAGVHRQASRCERVD